MEAVEPPPTPPMEIYRPVKTNRKTQAFSESRACSKIGVRPFQVVNKRNGKCPIGYESFYEALNMKGHNGEDWHTWHGEPIYFPVKADTTWYAKTEVDSDGGIGVDVISKSPVLEDGSYVKFRFWHLKNPAVYDGQIISFGQLIGFADNTGSSSGDHLHWSMKIVDKNGNTLNKDNGYYGAVDFSPWFSNEFALDRLVTPHDKPTKKELEQKLSTAYTQLASLLKQLSVALLTKFRV